MARQERAGRRLFLAGFLAGRLSFIYRWYDVRHVPLQNLFEVFLFLGVVCYPISWFCRRVLRIGGQWADMLIGAIVLVPAGFVFNAEPMQLPPALQSWLFAPHVAVYMLAYIFMAKAAFQAGEQLLGRRPATEQDAAAAGAGDVRADRHRFSAADPGPDPRQLVGQARLGPLLGLGPEGTLVAGLLAGLRRLFPLAVHVRQNARARQQPLGNRGHGRYHNHAAVGQPVAAVPGPAQLRDIAAGSAIGPIGPMGPCRSYLDEPAFGGQE